jgi:TonB family protein
MKFLRFVQFLSITLLVGFGSSRTFAQDEAASQKDAPSHKVPELKAVKTANPIYPEEARKKKIEGKVTLSIVVDVKGRVSEAKVLSGPSELTQAALDAVRLWEFEPPKSAPVVKTVEISFGSPSPCPGPESDLGEVTGRSGLRNDKGLLLGPVDDASWHLPPYSDEDRKAGVAGEMVLALTVNPKGEVTNVRVIKSLSPNLDRLAVDTARNWKYKVIEGRPENLPDEFLLHLRFESMCNVKF